MEQHHASMREREWLHSNGVDSEAKNTEVFCRPLGETIPHNPQRTLIILTQTQLPSLGNQPKRPICNMRICIDLMQAAITAQWKLVPSEPYCQGIRDVGDSGRCILVCNGIINDQCSIRQRWNRQLYTIPLYSSRFILDWQEKPIAP